MQGTVELLEEYSEGLQDLDGFSHIILLYQFHRSEGFELKVIPFLDTTQRGVFSTRVPKRPNPIGLSIVKLEKVEGRILHIEGVDILDGTPVIDIKPYVPKFDTQENVRAGWLEKNSDAVPQKRSDDRFV